MDSTFQRQYLSRTLDLKESTFRRQFLPRTGPFKDSALQGQHLPRIIPLKGSTIQIYTDGSKNEQGVGVGVAIFSGNKLVTKLKYKLDNRCSNNQAEQLAIAKALEALETIDIEENSPRTAAIITDSRISLDLIKNVNNHSYLIEEIRERLSKLERSNWTVAFAWVKTHAGILENELADQLAKTAARVKDKQPPTAEYL